MKQLLWLIYSFSPLITFGQRPELVVPVGHTWYINQLAYSPDGKYVLTGGNDGAAILWETQSGRKIFSFTEAAREVHAVAFSADGKLIASGNEKGEAVLWDARLGRKSGLLKGHDWAVNAVAFSPDNAWLATGGDRKVQLWDVASRKIIRTYEEHAAGVTALDFSPKGDYLISASADGTAVLRDLKNNKIKVFSGHTDGLTAVAFSPNGKQILTGSKDGTASLWEVNSGKARQTFADHLQAITTIGFSPDGRQIFTAGRDSTIIFRESQSGKRLNTFRDYPDQINTAAFSPDGKLFIAAGGTPLSAQNQAMAWDLVSGQPKVHFSGEYSVVYGGEFSPDGRKLRTTQSFKNKTVHYRWDLANGLNGQDTSPFTSRSSDWLFSPDSTYAVHKVNGLFTFAEYLAVRNRNPDGNHGEDIGHINSAAKSSARTGPVFTFSPDNRYLLFGDLNLAILKNLPDLNPVDTLVGHTEMVLAVAFSPDQKAILTGGWDDRAILWALDTKDTIRSLTGHRDGISSVAFSPDGKYLVTGSYDNTTKLWDRQNGQELATLVALDSLNWVVTTPSGLFDASPGAMSRMHYVANYRGEWVILELDQLKARYYEPGLLAKLTGFSNERIRPVEAFEAIEIYPKISADISDNILQVQLKARNGGIGKVSIFINGKEVVEEANPLPRRENGRRDSIIRYDLRQHQNYLFRHPDSTNLISVRAYNEAGWLKSQSVELEYQIATATARGTDSAEGSSAWIGRLDPKLYVISIGTSNYTGTKLDLQYADQDATMMARALQSVGTALFTDGDSLEVHCLSTASADSTGLEGMPIQWQFADKDNIKATFDAIKRQAKAEDVIVVYLSGHGITQGGTDQTQFYYLTQGVAGAEDLVDPATLRAYTISSEELTKWINDIPALKQVLIIDACNSGQIVENLTGGSKALNSSQIRALDRMKDRTGMFVLSGSASDKVSYEAGEYGQGLLTYALLQGMQGVATRKDREGKETVDVMKLFQYARDRVPELAASISGVQTPMLGFPNMGASFDIGILDETAKANIPIGNKKPVIIRSNFLNIVSLNDDLRLVERLEVAFLEEMSKGKDADFIYVDVNDYPVGYSLSGIYEQKEGLIFLNINLFQDGKPIASLAVGEDSDPDRLSKRILRALKNQLRIGKE